MNTTSRRHLLQVGTAATLATLWPLHARSAPLRTVRIGVANAPVGNPPVMSSASNIAAAYTKGWVEDAFASDGVKIEWVFFKGTGPAVNEALTNDQLDFAFQGDLPALIGRANQLPTRVLMSTSSRTNIYVAVPPDSTARSLADLRGKRVAFAKGTMTQLPANRLLEAAKLSERDLRVVSLDTATQLAALATRDIDAVFGSAILLKQRNAGLARIVGSTRDQPGFTGQSVMLVTERFAQAQPDAVARVVKTLVRSAHWSSLPENRDEILTIWGRGGTPAEVWREEFETVSFEARLAPPMDAFLTSRLKLAVADAQRYKLIRRAFDAEAWIDRRPVEAALASLKLQGHWKPYGADGRLSA
jgi:sulfonate transport system substrate-binding protein